MINTPDGITNFTTAALSGMIFYVVRYLNMFEVQGECITGYDQALLKMVWLFLGNRYVTPYVRI